MEGDLIKIKDKVNVGIMYKIGIEIGGTNIKVAVVNDELKMSNIVEEMLENKISVKEFKTNVQPETSMKEISEYIVDTCKISCTEIKSVCISLFGPLNLVKNSDDYGKILNTPKPGWRGFNVVNSLGNNLNISRENIYIETDVNCAANLEYKSGGHKKESLAYITIGTGVGVGLVINGQLIHGLLHPEGGHIRVTKINDDFKGVCSIHGDCLEGLVSNIALKERKGLDSVDGCSEISDDDPVWSTIAYYIAQLCLNLLYLNSLEKIIIGGGIINRQVLLNLIRKSFISLNNNYIDNPLLKEDSIHNYIDRTQFKNYSGILSAFSLQL